MNRREFARTAVAALGAAAIPSALSSAQPSGSNSLPFNLSVMLWTIYRDLPFEQRLEKVAEAGYHAVELVGEFKDWKKQDFAEARRKKRELGVEFDGTTGVWQPNPAFSSPGFCGSAPQETRTRRRIRRHHRRLAAPRRCLRSRSLPQISPRIYSYHARTRMHS